MVTLVVNTAEGSINALDLEVAGTFKSGVTEMDEGMYMVHYDTAKEVLGVEGAQRILIGFENDDETAYAASDTSVIDPIIYGAVSATCRAGVTCRLCCGLHVIYASDVTDDSIQLVTKFRGFLNN